MVCCPDPVPVGRVARWCRRGRTLGSVPLVLLAHGMLGLVLPVRRGCTAGLGAALCVSSGQCCQRGSQIAGAQLTRIQQDWCCGLQGC